MELHQVRLDEEAGFLIVITGWLFIYPSGAFAHFHRHGVHARHSIPFFAQQRPAGGADSLEPLYSAETGSGSMRCVWLPFRGKPSTLIRARYLPGFFRADTFDLPVLVEVRYISFD